MSQTSNKENTKKQNQDSSNSNTNTILDPEWNLPNRPPPQQIPNTPFVFYPAKNQQNKQNNNNNNNNNTNQTNKTKDTKTNNINENKSDEKVDTSMNNNNNENESKTTTATITTTKAAATTAQSNSSRIVSVEMNKNLSKSKVPLLTNDLNHVISEIATIHNRIFHLRRTNKEIKQFYNDDIDCQIAYKENIDVINRNLKNLFVYFDLYSELTNGKIHQYAPLYETDKKVIEKYQNIDSKSVEYMMPPSKSGNHNNTQKKNEQVAIDVSGQPASKEDQEADDDDGIVIDDDGGITL